MCMILKKGWLLSCHSRTVEWRFVGMPTVDIWEESGFTEAEQVGRYTDNGP